MISILLTSQKKKCHALLPLLVSNVLFKPSCHAFSPNLFSKPLLNVVVFDDEDIF